MKVEYKPGRCGDPDHLVCSECVDARYWCQDCWGRFTHEADLQYHLQKHKTHTIKDREVGTFVINDKAQFDYGRFFPKQSDR